MINIKKDTAFVKDVKLPSKLLLKIKAGCGDHSLCNKKSTVMNLSPVDYIKGGHHSTGKTFTDLFRYLTHICDTVIKNVYFDLSDEVQKDIARKNLHYYGGKGSVSDNAVKMMIKSTKELIINKDAVDYLSSQGAFSMTIEDTQSDAEMIGEFSEATLALLLFGGDRLHGGSLQKIGNHNAEKIRFNIDHYKTNLTFEGFLDMLTRVFFYYYSQKSRNFATARVLECLSLSFKCFDHVEVWDSALSKFVPYEATNLIRRNNSFSVRSVASNLNYYNVRDCERFDRKDINKVKDLSEEIFVTSVSNNVYLKKDSPLISHGGYAAYLNAKNNLGEAIGALLEFRHKDRNKSFVIANSLFNNRPLSVIMYEYPDIAILDKMTYDDYEMFDSTQSMAKSKDVSAEVIVAYFTRAGGKTESSYAELKNKRIPKQRRDLIYKALCHICYEYDVNPMDIMAKFDVDFTRYYKDAAPLE